jgi:recombinational DNA repair protein (RecF pathway)
MNSQCSETSRKLDDAARKIEAEVKGVIQHLNDHVVPKIRTEGTQALRSLAEELRRLADKMDDSRRQPAQK